MKIVPTILAMTIFQFAYTQNECNEQSLLAASNSNFQPLPFNQKVFFLNRFTGAYYGCAPGVRGEYCRLIIRSAYYDRANCEMEIEGYYVLQDFIRRSMPYNFRIFMAEPVKAESYYTLLKIRTVRDVSNETPIGYGDGYFKIRFSFSASDRLYFDAGPHTYLTEYSVGCILQRNEFIQPLNVR